MSQNDIFKDPTGESTGGGTSGSRASGGGFAGGGAEGGFGGGSGAAGSSSASGSSGQGGSSFGTQGSQAYESAKQGARSLGDQARQHLLSYAEDSKGRFAGQLDQFVQVIRRAGETMQEGQEVVPIAQYVSQAADQLEHLSTTIRDSSAQDLLRRAQRFGNRNRTAIFGGALLAGIALGRFAIASSQNRNARQRGGEEFGAGRYRVPARTSTGMEDRFRSQDAASRGSEPMTPSEGMGTL